MSELMQRLDNLRALIQTPEFLEGKGLSNEVNIRIFCYDPKQEMAVRYFTETLVTDQSLNCHVIEYKDSRTARYKQDIANKKVCADCVGLIKGYNWTSGGVGVREAIGTDKTFSSKYCLRVAK